MVKVFRSDCAGNKPRDPEETVLFADADSVKVELVDGHMFLMGDSDKILHVLAPGTWSRVQVL